MASPHEVIRYDLGEVKDLFDSCIVRAKLVDVHPSSNTVDIDTDIDEENPLWGQKNGVPVFYHCPETPDVDIGHQAFTRAMNRSAESGGGDVVVLVLCPNVRDQLWNPRASDLKVIGFASGLEYCEPVDILIVSIDDKAFLAWDLINNKKVTEFLGERVDPICNKDVFTEQFSRLTIHGIPQLIEFEVGNPGSHFIGSSYYRTKQGIGSLGLEWQPPAMSDQVAWDSEWGCGPPINKALWKYVFSPILNRKKPGCAGDPYDRASIIGPVGYVETVSGEEDLRGGCSHRLDFDGFADWSSGLYRSYDITMEQEIYWNREWHTRESRCPPYCCCDYVPRNPMIVSHGPCRNEVYLHDDMVMGLTSHGWGGPYGMVLPFEAHCGDWGSRLFGNIQEGPGTYVRTSMGFHLVDSNGGVNMRNKLQPCDYVGIMEVSSSPSIEISYSYYTHWGEISTYEPLSEGALVGPEDWELGSNSVMLKFIGSAEEDLQAQVFCHQRETDRLYIEVHAGVERRPETNTEDNYSDIPPNDLEQSTVLGAAIKDLVQFYYDNFAPGPGIDWTWSFALDRGELL